MYERDEQGAGTCGMTIDVAAPSRDARQHSRVGRRLLVVFNPAAGRRRRPRYDAVIAALRAEGCAVTAVETTAPGHAETIARTLAAEDYDAIVAAGGDGTVNEVVNGLGEETVALGIIPLGTANVLADDLGLPRRPSDLAKVLARGATRPLRVGVANGRRFCMMAGVGFDARVVAGVSLALKKRIGPLAYVAQTAKLAFTDAFAGCRVTIDGVAHEAVSAVVCKGRFYGGPFIAARDASVSDDRLHVILMRGRGWTSVLRYGLALVLGRIDRLADVQVIPAQAVTIDGVAGEPVQADGDIVARLPLAIAVDPQPLSVIGI